MEKKVSRINIKDLPEDITTIPLDTEVVIEEFDELMDDSFWDDLDNE